jgi:hypothetical protein
MRPLGIQGGKPNWSNIIEFLLACILLLSFLAAMSITQGCSPQKKVDRATQTVLMNESARNYIYSEVAKLKPCANDTTLINTKDTIYTDIIGTITDTIRRKDTIYISDTVTKRITKQVDRFNYIVDKRLLQSQEDSTDKYKKLYNQTNNQLVVTKSESDNWRLWFIVLSIFVLGFNILKIYLKFSSKNLLV